MEFSVALSYHCFTPKKSFLTVYYISIETEKANASKILMKACMQYNTKIFSDNSLLTL